MDELVLFYPTGHEAHSEPGHPERPERIVAIQTALEADGIWKKYPKLTPVDVSRRLLESVHSPAYLNLLERACSFGPGRLDMDTYLTKQSWELALNAAGGALAVAESVWQRTSRRGLALCRPPGHHAMRGQGMGFCLINNVALAAEFLMKEQGARRIAIVDLDLHHGNGTQDIFWTRKEVLFFSTHQSPFYPGSGSIYERGGGDALGTKFNFPMPPRSGDRAFLTVIGRLILPALEKFDPDMILVSYGFDTHWSDPLGSLLLSADGYARLISSLAQYADEHCDGRIALVLEGGYDLDAARECTLAVAHALLGEEWQDKMGQPPYRESDGWQKVFASAQELWQI